MSLTQIFVSHSQTEHINPQQLELAKFLEEAGSAIGSVTSTQWGLLGSGDRVEAGMIRILFYVGVGLLYPMPKSEFVLRALNKS